MHALKDALAEIGLDPEWAAPVLAEFLKTMAAQVGGQWVTPSPGRTWMGVFPVREARGSGEGLGVLA